MKFPKWWYVGRENEILLDLDSERAVRMAMDRIRRNLRAGLLVVDTIHFYRSPTPGHAHMFVTLKKPMCPLERATWALHLGSDLARGLASIMRGCRGVGGADLLIANQRYDVRGPDHTCDCNSHKTRAAQRACPVMRELRGAAADAEYFAKPRARPVVVPVGNVPLRIFGA